MAKFVDGREKEIQEEAVEGEEIVDFSEDQEAEEPVEEQQTSEAATEDDEIPDKYRNKDVKEIIAMHKNAEQLLGKQGQEVGELRRIVDDFISSQSVKEKQQAHNALEEFDETKFFENPKESIEHLLNNHPSVKQSQQLASQLYQQSALAKLKAQHPDFEQVVSNQDFLGWVEKSKIRTRLLHEADKKYNFEAADELLTLWKERQAVVNDTVKTEQSQRKKQVKSASSGTSKGSGESPSRKIYRRADIIDLMRKDPQRYRTLMPEIRQAYAEGRVK